MNDSARKRPRGLKTPGRRVWEEYTKLWTFDASEYDRLELAARTRDEMSDMERALRESAPLIAGSRGQSRVNPIYQALVAHRKLFEDLIASLKLPPLDGAKKTPNGWQGRKTNANRVSHFTSSLTSPPNRSA